MTHETLLIGPLTRDFIRRADVSPQGAGPRWSQPGGAVWHAGLALALAEPMHGARVSVVATAGPWARRCALPALAAAGVRCRGVESARDTAFVNRYDRDRRRQTLISRAPPLPESAIEAGAIGDPAAVVVSPLMPGDTPPGTARLMRARGAFVAADAQGDLRVSGAGGRIETRAADLRAALDGVQAVKFSRREFEVYAGSAARADWRAAAARSADALGVEIVVSLGGDGAAVAAPGAARVIDVPSPSPGGTGDTTGAGDILIAAYARARGLGLGAGPALERAVRQTHAVLRRRPDADGAGGRALLPLLRELQGLAALTRRRVRRGDACDQAFRPDGALARAVFASLPPSSRTAVVPAADDRAAALSGACWALFSAGWPNEPRLAPGALAALVAAERGRLCGPPPSDC